MDRPVEHVVVLGGGSAGFLAALALKVKVPRLRVRVIRSKDIGIIGVGEGSTVVLTEFLHKDLQVGRKKFFEVANPTWKLGLRFVWGKRPFFDYTFGGALDRPPPDGSPPRAVGFYCGADMAYCDPYTALMSHDRVFAAKSPGVPLFHDGIAYHFENEKFVRFLEGYATAKGVEVVDDTVREVRQDDRGVAGLALASGAVAEADLYVDCSGFASVLLGKALGEPFVSFAPSLFCERAVVGGWDRDSSPDPADRVIKPYTTCETMDAGWCWQIEHEHRINRGYVYAPGFISDEDAEREFRAKNPRVGPTRIVKFVSGRYERAWVKNVVAIGNAAGFVEPLEATALGAIAQQGRLLAEALAAGGEVGPVLPRLYNRFHALNWDAIRRFLAVHYRYNTRLDTPFWEHCRRATDLAGGEEIVAYFRENGPNGYWGPTLLDNPHDGFATPGYFALLVGMQVPYRAALVPPAAELAAFDRKRRLYRQIAEGGLTARDLFALFRSSRWRWAEAG